MLTKAKFRLAHPSATITDWVKYRYVGLRTEPGYTITLNVGAHGTCVADTLKISANGKVDFNGTHEEDYSAHVTVTNATLVDGVVLEPVTFQIKNPTSNVTVDVEFVGVK